MSADVIWMSHWKNIYYSLWSSRSSLSSTPRPPRASNAPHLRVRAGARSSSVAPSVAHCGSWRSGRPEPRISATPTLADGAWPEPPWEPWTAGGAKTPGEETVRQFELRWANLPRPAGRQTGPSALPHSRLRVPAEGARRGGHDSCARNSARGSLGETRGSSARLRRESRHRAPDRTKPHRRSSRSSSPRLDTAR